MRHSEDDEQAAVVAWAGYAATLIPDLALGFAIPNGAFLAGSPRQRAAQWARLKKAGAKQGVSDLFWPVPREGYHGLWIEMKAADKRPSAATKEQRAWIAAMRDQGYRAEVCCGAKAAIAVLEGYFGIGEGNKTS